MMYSTYKLNKQGDNIQHWRTPFPIWNQSVVLCLVLTIASCSVQFSSVTQLCLTLWDPMDHSMPGLPVHHQSQSLPKLKSIESVMPSNYLILCCPLFLLPSIFPSIKVFSNTFIGISASTLLRPMNTQDWSSLGWTDWISLQSKGLSRVFYTTTVQKHQFFNAQFSL